MNSYEISQMFAAQNSMFMGQNQMAQQVGAGLGTWGGMPRPGGHSTPFSYNPQMTPGHGYGAGNRAAGFGMSAIGGAAAIGAGLAFDPFGSFIGGAMGGLARGGLGAALGAGAMAALPMAAIGMPIQAGIGAVMRGGMQQGAINTTLGQNFNFMNPASRTGMGFTRDDAKAIGDQIRAISHIPEMMTSVEELNRMLPSLKRSGVMQGVRTATEFQSRFKEAIGTIRDMSKILGTTMEEAEKFFSHSRSIGFVGRGAQLRNTLNAQLTGAMTGMDTGQVMQLQQAGAGMAGQFGARRSLGVQAVTNIAQRLGRAQETGGMREGLLEDVTGMSGAEGMQAASQRMAQLMMQLSQSAPGKAIMAGAVKFDSSGRAVGMDESIIRRLNAGAMSLDELKARGSRLTDAQKISFTARASDLGASFAGQVDMGKFMQGLVGNKGGDAANLVLQRLSGGSAQDIDMLMSMGGGMGSNSEELKSMARMKARETSFNERTDPNAILRRLKTRLHSATMGRLESAGAKIHTEIAKAVDNVIDDFTGRAVVSLTQGTTDKLARAMSGGSKKELEEMIASAAGLKASANAASQFTTRDRFNMGALALGGVGMLMPGGGLGMAFAAAGGRGTIGKMLGRLGDSDLIASLNATSTGTGRSVEGQAAFSRLIAGSGSDEARRIQAELLNSGLGLNKMAVSSGAADAVTRIRAGIHEDGGNFRDFDNEKKLTTLRSELRSRIESGIGRSIDSTVSPSRLMEMMEKEGPAAVDKYLKESGQGSLDEVIQKMSSSSDSTSREAAGLLRLGVSAQKAGARDMLTGIIAAAQGEFTGGDMQIDVSKVLRDGADVDLVRMRKEASGTMKKALGALSEAGLSASDISVLAGNPDAGRAMSDLFGKDSAKSAAVRKALSNSNPEAAAKELAALGYGRIKPSDIEAMKNIRESGDATGGTSIRSAIDAYASGARSEQVVGILSAADAKAKELGAAIEANSSSLSAESKKAAQNLQAAYASLAKGDKGAFDSIQTASKGLVDVLRKGGKDAEALIAATGVSGEQAMNTIGQEQALRASAKGGKITVDDAMKAYGLSGDEARAMLEKLGISGGTGTDIKSVNVDEVTKGVVGFKNASKAFSAGRTDGPSSSEEEKMFQVLTKLDDTMKKTNAIMTLSASKWSSNITDKMREEAQGVLNETGGKPKEGA